MKKISHKIDKARQAICSGVRKLADAVTCTMGPLGKLVIIDRLTMFPVATKDGVTVAKEFESQDKVENIAIRITKEIAMRTEEEAGDGTTTSIAIANSIIQEGMRLLSQNHMTYMEIKGELEKELELVQGMLKEFARPIETREDIYNIALVSSNYDEEIAGHITDAIEETHRKGTIIVEDAKGLETHLDIVKGFSIDKGWASPYFVTHPDVEEVQYDNVKILLYKNRLADISRLIPILQEVTNKNQSLLIVADQISPEVLTSLVLSKLKNGFKVCVVHPPYHGDRHWAVFDDLAAISGGRCLDDSTITSMTLADLGVAEKIRISKKRSIIVAGSNREAEIKEYVKKIEDRQSKETSDFMSKHLKERISRITGGIGILHVGAETEFELREKKDRVTDAHLAVESALEEGVVAGAGITFLKIADKLREPHNSFDDTLLGEAISAPFLELSEMSGQDMDIISRYYDEGLMYNQKTMKFEDIKKTGIIDPVKVLRCALKNAVSVAKILLNTEMIIQYDEDESIREELND